MVRHISPLTAGLLALAALTNGPECIRVGEALPDLPPVLDSDGPQRTKKPRDWKARKHRRQMEKASRRANR